MDNFDKFWDIVITPPVWDGIIRGIRFSIEDFRLRFKDEDDLLDKEDISIIISALNAIPEDIKSNKTNIKTYLKYKRSFEPIIDKLFEK